MEILNMTDKIENLTRNAVIARIRKALKVRSGKSWSVKGGRGTAYGWIEIDAPPARRQFEWDGINPKKGEFGLSSLADRRELAQLLGLKDVHPQGINVPAGSDYYREYLARAEGRPIEVFGEQYWD